MDISQWESRKFDVLAKFSQHRGVGSKAAGSMDVDGEEQEAAGGDGRVETIISMAVSADGQWLATGDTKNRIFVFNLDTVQVRNHILERYSQWDHIKLWRSSTNLFLISHVILCFAACHILASCNSANI